MIYLASALSSAISLTYVASCLANSSCRFLSSKSKDMVWGAVANWIFWINHKSKYHWKKEHLKKLTKPLNRSLIELSQATKSATFASHFLVPEIVQRLWNLNTKNTVFFFRLLFSWDRVASPSFGWHACRHRSCWPQKPSSLCPSRRVDSLGILVDRDVVLKLECQNSNRKSYNSSLFW